VHLLATAALVASYIVLICSSRALSKLSLLTCLDIPGMRWQAEHTCVAAHCNSASSQHQAAHCNSASSHLML
jgi:hypothetical protein